MHKHLFFPFRFLFVIFHFANVNAITQTMKLVIYFEILRLKSNIIMLQYRMAIHIFSIDFITCICVEQIFC